LIQYVGNMFSLNSLTKNTLLSLLMAVFLGTLFLSLFHMSTDMSMTNHTPGCPMLMETGTICQMDYSEHLSAWSAPSLAIPLLLLMLFLLPLAKACAIACSVLFNQVSLVWKLLVFNFYQKQFPTYIVRGFQELFSSGILHPKLYHLA